MLVFDLQRFLAMERLLREVFHKNQELESANMQLYANVFELKSNQDQVYQDAIATPQKVADEQQASRLPQRSREMFYRLRYYNMKLNL